MGGEPLCRVTLNPTVLAKVLVVADGGGWGVGGHDWTRQPLIGPECVWSPEGAFRGPCTDPHGAQIGEGLCLRNERFLASADTGEGQGDASAKPCAPGKARGLPRWLWVKVCFSFS